MPPTHTPPCTSPPRRIPSSPLSRAEAERWLARRLRWESTLDGLRRRAGIAVAAPATAPHDLAA